MGHLALSLLGPLDVTLDGQPASGFRTDKERALLAFLALEAGRPHRREALATMLWGTLSDEAALSNLRKALHRLRQTLDDDFLLTTPKTIQFNPSADFSLDAAAFSGLLARVQKHRHRNPERCTACHAWLGQAAALFRGDLLQGFTLPDALVFDEWLAVSREHFHLQALSALARLAAHAERQGDYEALRSYAARQVALEPWNEAAHRQLMRALAANGHRAAALAQFETCRRSLIDELGVEPEAETITLYERLKAEGGSMKADPLLSAFILHPSSLPSFPTPFLGRAAELARLGERLLDPDYRLITLVGEGGAGKSRLALAAASEAQADFENGAWFVPLAGVSARADTEAIEAAASSIAATLGFAFAGAEPPATQLLTFLRGKEYLLVLDNFEHLLPAADLVRQLLEAAPRLVCLVTSREPLDLQAEYIMRVEGLPVPTSEADPQASTFDSVRLFAERAERAGGPPKLEGDDLHAAVQVCRYLAGLPLGIELAAAWNRRMAPPEIAQAIRSDLNFMASSLRDVPERHRSLRAVFEGSWRLLTAAEQAALAQASVFHGGFTAEAAHEVLGVQPGDLASLVDKSVLRQTSPGRFDLHELLRQFALEKLAETSLSSSSLAERHAGYYLGFVHSHKPSLTGSRPEAALAALALEIENVRQGWRWAVAESHAEGLLQGAQGLAAYYDHAGLYHEGSAAFESAVAALQPQAASVSTPGVSVVGLSAVDRALSGHSGSGVPDRSNVQETPFGGSLEATGDFSAPSSKRPPSGAAGALGWLWIGRAWFLGELGRLDEGATAALQAYEAALAAGDVECEAASLVEQGRAHLWQANYDACEDFFNRTVSLAQASGLPRLEADARRNLGIVGFRRGTFDSARVHLEAALELYRSLDDSMRAGRSILNLGILARYRGDYAAAWGDYAEALRLSREAGNQRDESIALANFANLADALGMYATGRDYHERALHLFTQSGDRLKECITLANMALLEHHAGDNRAARRHGQQALHLAQTLPEARGVQALALTNLGHALVELGDLDRAIELYDQALALQRQTGAATDIMETLAALARARLALGQPEAAASHVTEIVQQLETGSLDGAEEPMRVYLTCYQALQAVNDPRAHDLLQTGQRLLQAQANAITDPALRQSFLENVPAHRTLLQL